MPNALRNTPLHQASRVALCASLLLALAGCPANPRGVDPRNPQIAPPDPDPVVTPNPKGQTSSRRPHPAGQPGSPSTAGDSRTLKTLPPCRLLLTLNEPLPSNLEVLVDDRKSPAKPITDRACEVAVTPGQRKVMVRAGARRFQQTITVEEAEDAVLFVRLKQPSAASRTVLLLTFSETIPSDLVVQVDGRKAALKEISPRVREVAVAPGVHDLRIEAGKRLFTKRLNVEEEEEAIVFVQLAEDLPSGEVANLQGHTRSVELLAFSPDGRWLVSSSPTISQAIVWDVARRRMDSHLPERPGSSGARYSALVFTPSGEYLAAGLQQGNLGQIGVWKAARPFGVLLNHPRVSSLDVAPNGQLLASGGDQHARLWLNGHRLIRTFTHPSSVLAVRFAHSGQFLATGCEDGIVRIWGNNTLKPFRAYPGHTGRSSHVAFTTDGKWLLSASAARPGDRTARGDNTLRCWNLHDNREEWSQAVADIANPLTCVAFSEDGSQALCGHANGSLALWDLSTRRRLLVFAAHKGAVRAVVFSPPSNLAASGGDDRTVRLHRLSREKR